MMMSLYGPLKVLAIDQIKPTSVETSTGVSSHIAYEYDAEERITKVVDSVEGTTEYTYDALGQLLTETKNGTVVNTMTYDGKGNIVKTIDFKHKKEYNYIYDEGNLIRAVEYDITVNSSGVVTSKTRVVSIVYKYNYNGELLRKRALFPDGTECYISLSPSSEENVDASAFFSNVSGTAELSTTTETDGLGRKADSASHSEQIHTPTMPSE